VRKTALTLCEHIQVFRERKSQITGTKKAPKRLMLMFGSASQTRTGTPVKAANFEALAHRLTTAHCIDFKGFSPLKMLILARYG